MLGGGRKIGGKVGRQQWDLIFLAEQEEGVVLDVEEALDLGLARAPEYAGHGDARHQSYEAVRNTLGEPPAGFQPIDERGHCLGLSRVSCVPLRDKIEAFQGNADRGLTP